MVNLKSLVVVTIVLSILFIPVIYDDFDYEGFFPEINFGEDRDYSEAQLKVDLNDVDSASLEVIDGDLILEGLTSFESDGTDISSNDDIRFQSFTGGLTFNSSEHVKISGEAEGITTSDVEISEDLNLDFDSESSSFNIVNMTGENYFFENSTYDLKTNDSTLTGNANSSFDNFQGNLSVSTSDMTLNFTGGLIGFNSGEFSFN